MTNIEDTIAFFNKKNIKIFSTSLNASKEYQKIKYNQACAIVLGAEDKGISEKWISKSTDLIYIPMQGHTDSLNVSNSGAIIIYEAKRQRNFKWFLNPKILLKTLSINLFVVILDFDS